MDYTGILSELWPILIGFAVGSMVGIAALEVVKQLKELLGLIEEATSPDSPGGASLTQGELSAIAGEAKDVKVSATAFVDAIKRIFNR